MALESDLRQAQSGAVATVEAPLSSEVARTAGERRLLAEIDRLRQEVDRLNDQLRAERLGDLVELDVPTVLSSLGHPPPALDPGGRRLPDGRFIPPAIIDGGRSAPPEPGAPRVASDQDSSPPAYDPTRYEFAADDDSAVAFDQFFNAPDPQLEKTRRFLLG